ncbi:hypothetical protein PR048_024866 [Dryococelus australis]|uniref:Uncharacterized protein n=1 Tax=Dryococelus australis TaxID=614101 RepID=A0ABQ9GPU8_9NEOP|nr:hypothetical protein PR048_024866 [Dryococelus australis]
MPRHVNVLLLLLLWAAGSRGHGPCCPVDNVFDMNEKKCLNDTREKNHLLLNCSGEGVFLMDPIANPNDAFNVTDEGHLISLEMEHIAPAERESNLTAIVSDVRCGRRMPQTLP